MTTTAGGVPRAGHLPQQEDRREEDEGSDESEEEEEVESDDEGSEVSSPSDLGELDAGSDEDPTFDPDADGDLEVEAVLRARMSRISISASASARKGRKGAAVPKMGEEEIDLLAMVDRLKQDDQLEKLKVYECKAYLRMHKLRLTGKKEVLLNRIREHIEVKNDGEEKYPVSHFVLNCKGDACKGDVVIFEQNIYRRKKGAPRGVKGHLCGQRTNAGRIIKESYGTAKQQHTFTIEILWSKGYKPWPPLHPLLIKGRNLYKDKTMRQPWPDEEERNRVIQEKHERGDVARKSRAARIFEKETEKLLRLKRNKMKDKIKEQQNMNQKQPQGLKQKVKSTNTLQQRVGERKGPSPQNGEPGNTGQQHISSKAIFTHHNEMFPQMGATRNFQQEFNGNQFSSYQHGGPQPFSEPTHTQQMFKDSHHHHSYQQQNEVLSQDVAMITSRQAFLGCQAPSQHNGGSGSTKHHPISSKPTPSTFEYPQQPPKHQNHNKEYGPRRTYIEHHHQNNAGHYTEYDESSFHPQGKFTQHASPYHHGSNFHQNAPGSHQAHQPQRPRNQHQSKAYYATKYNDSFQHGKSTHHANECQRSFSSHQYAQANHRVHQPLRPRNQDFSSSDPSYGQDYHHQGCHDYRGITRGQYHPQQSRNQNYYSRRPMIQDQYLTQQSHHPNYNDHRKTNQKQYNPRQNQPQQFLEQLPQPRPCRYYKHGWCPYGKGCWYSHDI